MPIQNSLSDKTEHLISDMIRRGKLKITDYLSCSPMKRCDECPLQGQDCYSLRRAYELKYYPELFI